MEIIAWGYSEPGKRKPLDKIRSAMEMYRWRHGFDATHVMLHGSLIREIADPPLVLVEHAIPAHSFFLYVGDSS